MHISKESNIFATIYNHVLSYNKSQIQTEKKQHKTYTHTLEINKVQVHRLCLQSSGIAKDIQKKLE